MTRRDASRGVKQRDGCTAPSIAQATTLCRACCVRACALLIQEMAGAGSRTLDGGLIEHGHLQVDAHERTEEHEQDDVDDERADEEHVVDSRRKPVGGRLRPQAQRGAAREGAIHESGGGMRGTSSLEAHG